MGNLVAWVVELDDDWHEVVFERSEGRARVRGACKEGLEPRGVKARREPRLDAHAPGPVPAEALLAIGWRLECGHCYHEVDNEGCFRCAEAAEEDVGHEVEGEAPVMRGQKVWCSEACRRAEERERAESRRRKAAARSAVAAVFPESTAVSVSLQVGGDVLVEVAIPECRGRTFYRWPEGTVSCAPHDMEAVRTHLLWPALASWESEGGAAHG